VDPCGPAHPIVSAAVTVRLDRVRAPPVRQGRDVTTTAPGPTEQERQPERTYPDRTQASDALTRVPASDAPYDALLVLSFGGPEGQADVIPFLANVTKGRGIPPERLEEVAGHYRHLGGVSPVNEHARRLVTALAAAQALPVYGGNRNWAPYVTDTLREMGAGGVRRALCFVTSAFPSWSGCRQYREDLGRARATLLAEGAPVPVVEKLRHFGTHPAFLGLVHAATRAAVERLGEHPERLVFTAHSIPTSMADTSLYEARLREAAAAVAARLDVAWELVWQSRSGPPSVPWLAPDVSDAVEDWYAGGLRSMVVVPLGFVSDHVEVVWDLDTELAERVAALPGLRWERAGTPGTDPDPGYVRLVLDLVGERVRGDRAGATPPGVRGASGPTPDACPLGCCPGSARPAR